MACIVLVQTQILKLQPYEFIRDQLLIILPHPAQGGGGNMQNSAHNTSTGGDGKGKSNNITSNSN